MELRTSYGFVYWRRSILGKVRWHAQIRGMNHEVLFKSTTHYNSKAACIQALRLANPQIDVRYETNR